MAVDSGVSGGITSASVAWSTGVTLTLPSNSSGDLLVAHLFRDEDDAGDWNTPTGWTRQSNLDGVEIGGRDRVNGIFTKVSSGSEPSTLAFTGTVATVRQISGHIIRYSSADGLDVTPTTSHKSTGTNDATPPNAAITTNTDDAMVVLMMGLTASNIDTWAAPTNYTLVDSTLQANAQIAVAERLITTAGLESPGSWLNTVNGNIAEYSGATLVVKPSVAAGTTIAPDEDTISIAGQSLTLTTAASIAPDEGTFSIAGQALTFDINTILSPSVDTITIAGQDVTTTVDVFLTPLTASFSIAGQAVTVAVQGGIVPETATIAIAGDEVSLVTAVSITPADTSFGIAGQALTTAFDRGIIPDAATITINGQSVTVDAVFIVADGERFIIVPLIQDIVQPLIRNV